MITCMNTIVIIIIIITIIIIICIIIIIIIIIYQGWSAAESAGRERVERCSWFWVALLVLTLLV